MGRDPRIEANAKWFYPGPDFIRKISLSMTALIERPAVCPVVLSHENNSAQTRRTTA
jgi:hypothetical protein